MYKRQAQGGAGAGREDAGTKKKKQPKRKKGQGQPQVDEVEPEEETNEADLIQGELEMNDNLLLPRRKKPRHTRVFSNHEENQAFKQTVSQFIESRIQISQNKKSFITSKQILDEFKKSGLSTPSETLFFTEVRNLLDKKRPSITYKQAHGIRKYNGASFKF